MGKSQTKKKTRGGRHNPMRVPDSHLGSGKDVGKPDAGKEKALLPILGKLSAPEYADRTWACAAVSNLIQNDPATRRLFQGKNVVGALIERLTDNVEEVVVEASGALRNLAIDGGHELCAEMFNKGIMSHLTVLISKISNTIETITGSNAASELSDADYQSRKHLLSLTENVLSLIWSLAEANHKTLAAVNAAGVEVLLFNALAGREKLGLGVALAAGQALYSLSQDNPDFEKRVLSSPSALLELVKIVEEEDVASDKGKGKGKAKNAKGEEQDDGRELLLKLLVSGSLRNLVIPGKRIDEDIRIVELTNRKILPYILSVIDLNLDSVVQQVYQLVQQSQTDTAGKLNKGGTDHRTPSEVALDRIERTLTTVTVALEILTGICAGIEDMGEAMDGSVPSDEDDEMDEDAAEGDIANDDLIEMARDADAIMDPISMSNGNHVSTSVTLPYLLSELRIPQRLTALSNLTSLSFPPANNQPSPHPPTTSLLSVLHLRALEALNNLLLTVVASISEDSAISSQLAGSTPLAEIWQKIFAIIDVIGSEPDALRQKGQEMRMEVLEMCIGCLWGLAKVDANAVGCSPQQQQSLMKVFEVIQSEVMKGRSIELLSCLASRQSVSTEENKEIGTWLVNGLQPSIGDSVELLVDLINAIIDVYADEGRQYDQPAFVAGGFLNILKESLGRVRSSVKGVDRRKNLRLRARGEEAYENLAAFVKYRRDIAR